MNTFGQYFRVTTFGESHGPAVGAVIDGCPPGLELSTDDIQAELDLRRPGQSELTTPRKEPDRVEILSGVFEGKTLGTSIALIIFSRSTAAGIIAAGAVPRAGKPQPGSQPERWHASSWPARGSRW